MVLFHHDGTQERRNHQQRESATHRIGPPMGKNTADKRQEEGEHQGDGRHRQCTVYGRDAHKLHEQRFPISLPFGVLLVHGDIVQGLNPCGRQMAFQHLVARSGHAYHIRSEERGDDRHRHHDRIDKLADDTQRQPQRGNDK